MTEVNYCRFWPEYVNFIHSKEGRYLLECYGWEGVGWWIAVKSALTENFGQIERDNDQNNLGYNSLRRLLDLDKKEFDDFLNTLTRIGLLRLKSGWYSNPDITAAIQKAQSKAELNKQRRKG